MSNSKKVLHAIYSLDPKMGGTVEAIVQLLMANRSNDQVHEIICLDAPGGVPSFNHPVKVHYLGPTKSFYGYSRTYDKWLEKHIPEYDLAVIHGCWQYHGLGAFRACKEHRVPYIQYPHGMLDPWFKRAYPLKHLKKWLYWPWAEYRILKNANKVVFTSQDERDLATRSFWLYQVNPQVIPLGIRSPDANLEQFEKDWTSKHPELKEKKIILFFGRIHPKKGVDLLLDAITRINLENDSSYDDSQKYTVLIAGPCHDSDYLSALKNRLEPGAFEQGPIREVIWMDMVTGNDKWGILSNAEAFILPSHQENFGMVIPESLSCETPVLISNKVNIWREVAQSEAGLVEDDNVEGTIALLKKWIQLPQEKKTQMKSNSLKCFHENFRIEQNAQKLFTLIDQILL